MSDIIDNQTQNTTIDEPKIKKKADKAVIEPLLITKNTDLRFNADGEKTLIGELMDKANGDRHVFFRKLFNYAPQHLKTFFTEKEIKIWIHEVL